MISKREAQCLYYMSQGKSVKQISKILNISNRTVESHISNIKVKTGINSKNIILDFYYSTIQGWIF